MLEYYETYFGIFNHVKSINPLDSVTYHKAENYIEDGLMDTYTRVYMMKDLFNKTGFTLDQFVSLPKYHINRILQISDELDKRKTAIEGTAYKQLTDVQKDSKN